MNGRKGLRVRDVALYVAAAVLTVWAVGSPIIIIRQANEIQANHETTLSVEKAIAAEAFKFSGALRAGQKQILMVCKR